MNPIGVVCLAVASLLVVAATLSVHRMREPWLTYAETRAMVGVTAGLLLAVVWCLAVGVWLVVTR